MKKVYYFSLFLTIGLSIFASGGGADKYGNTHSSGGGGGGGGADETVSTTFVATGASDRKSHSHRGTSVAQNQVFGNQYLAENIGGFISGREATQGLGLVNKSFHKAVKYSSRCARAASIAQPIILRGHEGGITSVVVSPDGRIVSGSRDHTVRVWNLRIPEGQPGHMIVLRGHDDWVNSVAIMQDGRIVSGSGDGTVRVWNPDIAVGQMGHIVVLGEQRSYGGWNAITSVAVLPDDRIISKSEHGTVLIWNPFIRNGKRGHKKRLQLFKERNEYTDTSDEDEDVSMDFFVAVMPDGRFVLTSFDEATIKLWNPAFRKDQPGYLQELQMSIVIDECSSGKYSLNLTPNMVVMSDGRLIVGRQGRAIAVWPSESYFENKVKRTSKREDYLVDGPGVYEMLFGVDAPVSAAEAAAALDQPDHQGGGADAQ